MQDFKKPHPKSPPARSAHSTSSIPKSVRRGMSAFPARERRFKRWTRLKEQRQNSEIKKSAPFSWLKLSLKMAGIAVFLFTIWLGREIVIEGLRLSKTSIQNIYIQGNSMLSRFEVLRITGIVPGISWAELDPHQVSIALQQHSFVARTSVRKRFPDSLFIQLEEYTPVAILKTSEQHYLLDREQRILNLVSPESPESSPSLPLLTGLSLGALAPGKQLHSPQIEQGLSFLKKLENHSNNGLEEIQEVDISDILNLKVHIKLPFQPSSEDTANRKESLLLLKLGNNSFYERLRNFRKIVPLLKSKYPDLREVDLRFHDRVILKS